MSGLQPNLRLPSDGSYQHKETPNITIQAPVQYGHKYGWENRRLLKAADDLGMTQKQLNDYVNARAANIFDPQNKTDNLSHKHEKPGMDDLDRIKKDMMEFLNGEGV